MNIRKTTNQSTNELTYTSHNGSNSGHSRKLGNLGRILGALIFIWLCFFTSRLHQAGTTEIRFGSSSIPFYSINGLLTVLANVICIVMACTNPKKGRRLSECLLCLSMLTMLISILLSGHLGPLPGLANTLLCLLSVEFICRQITRREHDLVTDTLTGLNNRAGLIRELQDRIADHTPFYLFYMDLDDFKMVNDTLGHNVGDQVLQIVGHSLIRKFHKHNFLARIGGDEFMFLFPGSIDWRETAQSIQERIGNPLLVRQIPDYPSQMTISGSIGIVRYPEDASDVKTLIQYADIAMYQSKHLGHGSCYLFDQESERQITRKARLEKVITEALRDDNFFLVYQPQFTAGTKKLRGFETLIRMSPVNGEFISPGEFIAVAENSDLIFQIDEYVLNRAMHEFSSVIKHNESLVLSVNVSARNICRFGFLEMIRQILEKEQFPPKCLEIEITEYCMAHSIENATKNINGLKDLGVHVALDDFGTGYASLSNLNRLHIDLLKIDKSFVDTITTDVKDRNFVQAVISIGHINDCEVISEGVETTQQQQLLSEMGCDFIQGYVWGRPMSYEDAVKLAET